ncbi:hypothetical protein F7734_42670 [Scytonema sp. UIC 10036]|uniref:pre-peptidase C-terminal domain-containing protein n=1 Tax=Scytonema sp. UIC 10036 TaxID=2304196 RepID=UPI0012DAF2FD|nr:pre-peptidase C-terminal domain-containing protein [Scytonema sp. UIC 10036]MUG98639.1 hypothetical protein [Scytonema sp. UIC 10036]
MLDINSLFDESYYLANNPDVQQAVSGGSFANGLAHFNQFGKFENRNLCAFFDGTYYLEQNPDVEAAVEQKIITAIDHFIAFGQKEQRDPLAEFSTNNYLQQNTDVDTAVKGGMMTAYEHFVKHGQYEGRNPGGDFVTNFYLQQNTDVANAVTSKQLTAIQHFLQYGQKEGRMHSNIAPGSTLEESLEIKTLTGNRIFSGSVSGEKPLDIYSFTLSKTSLVNLKLDGLSADADINIARDFDEDGEINSSEELDASEQEGTTAESLSLNLTPGTYFAQVYQYEEGQNTPYRLNLQATPFLTPATSLNKSLKGAVSLGSIGGVDTFQGTLNKVAPVKLYNFSLDENRDFSLWLEDVSANASIQLIRDFNNNKIIDKNEVIDAKTATSDSPGVISFNRQEAGSYFVLLQSQGNDTNYQLTLEAPGSSSTGEETIELIGSHETVEGNLSLGDTPNPLNPSSPSIDYLLTDVVANQSVTINLTSSQFDTALQVVTRDTGELIAENDNLAPGNTNSALSFTPKVGEDYIIRVTSFAPVANSTGSFTLTTNTTSPIVGNLVFGQPAINGKLVATDLIRSTPAGESQNITDDYLLTGINAGQQVKINLNSTEFDTYLELVNRVTGEVIAENDDISNTSDRNSQLIFTAQAGIEYVVRVTSFDDKVTGNYTLSASALSSQVSVLGSSQVSVPNAFANFLTYIKAPEVKNIVSTHAADGELNRNEMLEIYKQVEADNTISQLEFDDLTTLVKETTVFTMPDSVRFLSNNVVQGSKAGMTAIDFENNLVGKWFKGTPEGSTVIFTAKYDSNKVYNYTYKAVQGNLFGANGPTIGDIAQNPFGNCYFVAGLGSMFGQQRPPKGTTDDNPFRGTTTAQAIKDMIVENNDPDGSTSYTVRFYNREGKAEYVTVDKQLITENQLTTIQYVDEQKNPIRTETRSKTIIAGSARNTEINDPNNVLWVPILERAYAQWLGSYDKMGNGGSSAIVQYHIKGVGDTVLYSRGKGAIPYALKKPEVTFQTLFDAFQQGKSVTAGNSYKGNKVFFSSHAYAVTDAYSDANGVQHVVVYNPHGQDVGADAGVDGEYKDIRVTSPRLDGFVDVTFDEFRETMSEFRVL